MVFKIYLFLFYLDECFAFMYVYTTFMHGTPTSQKRALDCLKLEVQMIVSPFGYWEPNLDSLKKQYTLKH